MVPGLEAKVAFLKQACAYGEGTSRVKAIETHISWVFLTNAHAYKLKKPVRHPFLDFTTLDARRQDCEEEVRLNRRLAADVYLGTVPLVLTAGGHLVLDASGKVVDWLVQMRRLPDERMLDRLIGRHAVPEADLRRLIQVLTRFYRSSPPIRVEPAAYRRQLEENIRADAQELLAPSFGLPADSVHLVLAAQLAVLKREPELFEARARHGRIVEGHGDLRPEHVCLEAEPVVIDCLEFNRDFRILDAADELAFLALECERLGDVHSARFILDSYREINGDRPPDRLFDFYKAYRACLRAKLAAWHLRDPQVPNPGKWLAAARSYLLLAEKHLRWVS